MRRPPRVLVFIVAYNAERTIQSVLKRIPAELAQYDTHVLIIDDSSRDRTFERAREFDDSPFPITVLFNPVNQGYGGNQKVGFQFAIREGFDVVALVHGDGQYAPECLADLLQPLLRGEAEAVFGSRMLDRGGARRGGMPAYKFIGNKILTAFQNHVLRSKLSEFHSGYRLYSVPALEKVPFALNTNDFHFDTEIIIQFQRAGLRIRELPIPTYYGTEICHVNGMKYAWDVVKATLLSRAVDLGILYQRNFDVEPDSPQRYRPKWGFESPHTLALDRVEPASAVLAIGPASAHLAAPLRERDCEVTLIGGADLEPDKFPVLAGSFRRVLLLDVLEHLRSPEAFLQRLRASRRSGEDTVVLVSTGNIAFFVVRLMLFCGFFHYGARGILDLGHARLYTFTTLRKLFEQAGYSVLEVRGLPAPFPLALGETRLARLLLGVNRFLIRVAPTWFSYQIFLTARPAPSLEWLLDRAVEASRTRVEAH